MNDLETRILKLEKSSRRWRAGAIALVCLLLMLGMIAPAAEKNLRANSLTIVDARGNEVALLGVGEIGNISFSMAAPGSKGQIIFGIHPDGQATIGMFGPDGKRQIVLKAIEDAATIELQNQSNLVTLASLKDQGGMVSISNTKGDQAAVGIIARPDKGGALVLRDDAGQMIFKAPQK